MLKKGGVDDSAVNVHSMNIKYTNIVESSKPNLEPKVVNRFNLTRKWCEVSFYRTQQIRYVGSLHTIVSTTHIFARN